MTDAQTLLQEGLSAFRARAYDQALQAWRALLDIEPDNQQVLQLVERTEALAAEGQLVHSLKEELADLREALAATRQARNDLLMEMARVHKRYQAREARLWRLQETREWELRDALARAELAAFESAAQPEEIQQTEANAIDPDAHELTQNALQEAHAHIQRLRNALDEAQERIHALEKQQEGAAQTRIAPAFETEAQTASDAPGSIETPDSASTDAPATEVPADAAAQETAPAADTPSERGAQEPAATQSSPDVSAQDSEAPPPASETASRRTHTDANPHTQTEERRPTNTRPSYALLDDGQEPSRKTPTPYRQLSAKHTQTSHTLTVSRAFDEHDQDAEDTFGGPLIADEWLHDPNQDAKDAPIADELVDIVRQANAPIPSEEPDAAAAAPSDAGTETPASDPSADELLATNDDGVDEDLGEEHATMEHLVPPEALEIESPSTDPVQEIAPARTPEPPKSASAAPPIKPAPPQAPPAPAEGTRANIPDTAKIDPTPMDDKNIADGFADELTSALGSTPAPPRLFTGVQPELPDMDILENEPEKMAPDDLDKYPTAIPIRHKLNPQLDDPIARYLLTHVDGVSTFMELRGTVGLPPAAVDRGFRILLAHDVIRVQHQ